MEVIKELREEKTMWMLVHKDNDTRVFQKGDIIRDGDHQLRILYTHPPRHHNSSGHVTVEDVKTGERPGMAGYCYVHCFDLKWVWKSVSNPDDINYNCTPIAAERDDVTGSTPWL